jgi:hypothetical protein
MDGPIGRSRWSAAMTHGAGAATGGRATQLDQQPAYLVELEPKKLGDVGFVRPAQHPTHSRRLPDDFGSDRTGADPTFPELKTADVAIWSPR